MTHALLIARREIVDRRNVFIAAAVVTALSLLFAVFPFAPKSQVKLIEAITVLSLVNSFGFGLAMAMMCGATMIGRDLSERRLGFYLVRPLSAASLWFGKLFGTLIVVFASAALIAVPAMIFNRFQMPRSWSLDEAALGAPLILVATVLIAHVLSTVIRSRSAWIAVDVAVLGVCGYIWWRSLALLFSALSVDVAMWVTGVAAAVILLALAVSGVVQISTGRSDVRRSHRALSIFMLSVVAVLSIGAAAYTAWFFSPEIDDLQQIYAAARVPRSNWLVVGGTVKGRGKMYAPTFLFDSASGKAISLRGASAHFAPTISADGSTLIAWGVTRPGKWEDTSGYVVDLRAPAATPRRIELPLAVAGPFRYLSPDGRYLLAIGPANLGVISTKDGASVLSAAIHAKRAIFLSPTVARVFAPGDDALEIRELDLSRRSLATVAKVEGAWSEIAANRDATRLLVRTAPKIGSNEKLTFTLVDGNSGAILAPLGTDGAKFLPDGRFVTSSDDGLVLRDANGAQLRALPMRGLSIVPAALSSDGRSLYVLTKRENENWRNSTTLIVSLDSFAVAGKLEGLKPAMPWWKPAMFEPTDLFSDWDGKLVKVDAKSGARTPIAGLPGRS